MVTEVKDKPKQKVDTWHSRYEVKHYETMNHVVIPGDLGRAMKSALKERKKLSNSI